jgi:hypothetical protein
VRTCGGGLHRLTQKFPVSAGLRLASSQTKADAVKLIQQAVADGANLIEQQGDAGLDRITKYSRGNRPVHNSYIYMFAIEHSGEHYGQLVVYDRANNLVPPDSRR